MNRAELDHAIATNARLIAGFAALPSNIQARLAILMLRYQEEAGLEPDAAYDLALERALNRDLVGVGWDLGGVTTTQLPGAKGFTAAEVVGRWLSQVEYAATHDKESDYGLGHGALWTAPNVFAKTKKADCRAFVHYGLGTVPGPYNTDGMVADAYKRRSGRFVLDEDGRRQRGPCKLFEPVEDKDVSKERARPGDVIVYPGPDRNHDGKRERAGHMGGIVDILDGFAFGEGDWEERIRIAHCRWITRAARVTDGSFFDESHGDVVIVRCRAVRYP